MSREGPNLEDASVLLQPHSKGGYLYEYRGFMFDHDYAYQSAAAELRESAVKPDYILLYYLRELTNADSVISPEDAFELCVADEQFVNVVASYMRLKSADEQLDSLKRRIKRTPIDTAIKKRAVARVISIAGVSSLEEIQDIVSSVGVCVDVFAHYAQILIHHYLTDILLTGKSPAWMNKEPYSTLIGYLTAILEELEVSTPKQMSTLGARMGSHYVLDITRVMYMNSVICTRMAAFTT